MSCTSIEAIDLKAYALGEIAQRDKIAVEDHVRGCAQCREELERLNMTQAALLTLEAEEIPQRIAFVSDQVFEPRWWQTMWRSGPAMGFASAALLGGAILVHGFTRASGPVTDTAQIEQRVERQVSARLDSAITKAVGEAQARQSAEFAKVLNTVELQRRSDLASFQQTAEYYEKQVHRFEVASNEGPAQ